MKKVIVILAGLSMATSSAFASRAAVEAAATAGGAGRAAGQSANAASALRGGVQNQIHAGAARTAPAARSAAISGLRQEAAAVRTMPRPTTTGRTLTNPDAILSRSGGMGSRQIGARTDAVNFGAGRGSQTASVTGRAPVAPDATSLLPGRTGLGAAGMQQAAASEVVTAAPTASQQCISNLPGVPSLASGLAMEVVGQSCSGTPASDASLLSQLATGNFPAAEANLEKIISAMKPVLDAAGVQKISQLSLSQLPLVAGVVEGVMGKASAKALFDKGCVAPSVRSGLLTGG
jgi:hypothetical protein